MLLKLILIISSLLTCFQALATTSPRTFTYEGRLYDNAGNPSEATSVTFTFEILDPSETCVLYRETHTGINLDSANPDEDGFFALRVGQGTPVAPFGSTFGLNVFSNEGNIIAGDGCNYTPNPGEVRFLQVTVDDDGIGPNAAEVLSPNTQFSSVPNALVADTLQGKQPLDFIQTNGSNTTQSNINDLADRHGALTALGDGTSSLYLKNDGSGFAPTGPVNFGGQIIDGLADPADGNDAATKNYSDGNIAGWNTDASLASLNAGNDGEVLTWDGTNSRWVTTAATGDNLGNHTATTNIDMGSTHKVINLAAPTNAADATTKTYVDTEITNAGASYVEIAGDTMTGDLDMGTTQKVINLAAPTNPGDATTKTYVDTEITNAGASYVEIAGDTMTGDLDMGTTQKVINLAAPTNAADAVNKTYADTKLRGFDLPAAPGAGQDQQVLKWNNGTSQWIFANDDTGSGGTVTTVGASNPLTVTNPTTTPSITLNTGNGLNLDGSNNLQVLQGTGITVNGTGVNVDYGTAANTAVQGNDTRIGDATKFNGLTIPTATTPANDGMIYKYSGGVWSLANDDDSGGTVTTVGASNPLTITNPTTTPSITLNTGNGLNLDGSNNLQVQQGTGITVNGTGVHVDYGTAANTAVQGNDTRIGDATKVHGRDVLSTAPTDGQVLTWVNGNNRWEPVSPSGGGITSFNGETGASQNLLTPGTAGNAPSWTSSGNNHTLNIPMANTAAVTAGLISNTEFNQIGNATKLQGNDVFNVGPGDGQVLKWNGPSSRWEPSADAGITTELDPTVESFAKTALPTCGAGEVLKGDGTNLSCVLDLQGVASTRAVNTVADSGLTGGGDLTADRNLSVNINGTTNNAEIIDDADEILVWDTTQGALRKMTKATFVTNIPSGNIMGLGAAASLDDGTAGTDVVQNSDVPNCSAAEKLQMSAGPTFVWSCEPDNTGGLTGSGTSNKLTKFTAATAVADSIITDDGTNIGVNVPSPQERLDVAGAIRIGNTTNTNDGTIRWNGTNFQGRKTGTWVDLDVGGGSGVTSITPGTGLTATANPIVATGTISIAGGGVGNAELAANAVTSAKIFDSTITQADLANDSVNTVELVNDSVTSAKIDDGTITSVDIANNSIVSSHVQTSAITDLHLATNSVGASELKSNSVGQVEIMGGAIVDSKINSSANISGTKINADFGNQIVSTLDRIGIGTTSPAQSLHIEDGRLHFSDTVDSGPPWEVGYDPAFDHFYIDEFGVGRHLTIKKTSGNVGIGTYDPKDKLHLRGVGTDDADIRLEARSDGTNPISNIKFYRAQGTSSDQAVVAGNNMGHIEGSGYDGTGYEFTTSITFAVDGPTGVDQVPGSIQFKTSPDTDANKAIRMIVKNDGKIGIGTQTPQALLDVAGSIKLGDEGGGATDCDDATDKGRLQYNQTNQAMEYCAELTSTPTFGWIGMAGSPTICPAGYVMNGLPGHKGTYCIERDPAPESTDKTSFHGAIQACKIEPNAVAAGMKAHLCRYDEWFNACVDSDTLGINYMIAGGDPNALPNGGQYREWINDVTRQGDEAVVKGGTTSAPHCESTGSQAHSALFPYRCCVD